MREFEGAGLHPIIDSVTRSSVCMHHRPRINAAHRWSMVPSCMHPGRAYCLAHWPHFYPVMVPAAGSIAQPASMIDSKAVSSDIKTPWIGQSEGQGSPWVRTDEVCCPVVVAYLSNTPATSSDTQQSAPQFPPRSDRLEKRGVDHPEVSTSPESYPT